MFESIIEAFQVLAYLLPPVLILTLAVGWYVVRNVRMNRPRGLFAFNDGRKIRELDPSQVLGKLAKNPLFDPSKHLKAAWDGDPEAKAVCLEVARETFGVVPFTSKKRPGLSDCETLDLLCAFYEWTHALRIYREMIEEDFKAEAVAGG